MKTLKKYSSPFLFLSRKIAKYLAKYFVRVDKSESNRFLA